MAKELRIPQDKNYYTKMSFLMPFVVAMGTMRAYSNIRSGESLLSMNFWVIVSLISIVVFVRVLIRAFDKTPAFLLNKDGIVDNASLAKAGLIPWDQILSGEVKDYAGTSQFILKIKDPGKYINDLKYINKKMAAQMIQDEGSPIIVNTRFIKYSAEKLVEVVNRSARVGRLKV